MKTKKALSAALVIIAAMSVWSGPTPALASAPRKFDDGSALSQVLEQIRLAPFRFERMTLPVSIGSGPPLTFLIDTGAELSGVSPDVASRYGLEPNGSRTVIGFAGKKDVPSVVVPGLRFARNEPLNVEALVFAKQDMGADGFLGINGLTDQRIEFNFENATMKLGPAPKLRMQSSAQSVVVRAQRKAGRLVFSTARVNGVDVNVMLDTGSAVTVGNAALMKALAAKQRLGETIPIDVLSVTGKTVTADYGVLREVVIGDVMIRRLPIAFATIEPFHTLGWDERPALLLGMDALRVFSAVTVDFRNRAVKFVARKFDPHEPAIQVRGSW